MAAHNALRAVAVLLAAVWLVGAAAPAPLSYRLDPAASDVAAKVGFLGVGSRSATFPTLTGSASLSPAALDRIDLNVRIDARQLKASDKLTTDRLRGPDFFDVTQHPTVGFQGRALTMTSATEGRVDGALTVRGITKPVTLAVTFAVPPARAGRRDSIGLVARTTINRRDFGMTAYSLVVGKKVSITIRTRLVPAA